MTSRMYESPPPGGSWTAPEPHAHEPHTNEPHATGPRTTGSHEAGPTSPRAVQAAAKEMVTAAKGLRETAKEFSETAQSYAGEQARERPYVLLGAAAAVGFVLGGGLASRITMNLLLVGGRMVAGRMIAQALQSEELLPEQQDR